MVALLFLVAFASAIVPFNAGGDDAIAGEYIVVFKDHATQQIRDEHFGSLKLLPGDEVVHKFNFPAHTGFSGYIAKLSKQSLGHVLKEDNTVKYVDENVMHYINDECRTSTDLPQGLWGLSRSNQHALPLDFEYTYDHNAGFQSDAYILDTGIQCSHVDFEDRCTFAIDTTGEGENDQHGHGTHVAGTVAGALYGISKHTDLFAVKVCNRGGSCPAAGQLIGLEHISNNQRPGRHSVGNMSLGGAFRQSSNDAVNAVVNSGVSMVVSAGNSNADACNQSPASAELAITIGATDNQDRRSTFSNFGTCVDIFGPGTGILGPWIGGSNTESRAVSGTSMSSPHVAGAVAVALSDPGRPNTPAEIKAEILADATEGALSNIGTGSPNLLMYTTCNLD